MMKKRKFLINQAIASSIIAAFQHGGVYVKGLKPDDSRKSNLRKELAARSFGEEYSKPVTEEEHCRNIEDLANTLTENYKGTGLLRKERFRIGIAQKALNVYLKNLWCLGEIVSPPPHCPLDRQIIDKLPLKSSERSEYDWTKLDNIEKYKELIRMCHEEAKPKYQNVAEWELETYEGSIRDSPP
jgi:hypothetical protein